MKKTKYYIISLCLILCAVIIGHFAFAKIGIPTTDNKITRAVEAKIDYNALLETFDSYELTQTDEKIVLNADKRINLNMTELDNLSSVTESENTTNVRYSYEYDLSNDLLYMTITFTELEEIVSTEKFVGAAFYDEYGNVDAVFNIDGEAVLLSEFSTKTAVIQNCGWFSNLIKVVCVVVVVVAVVAVVATAVVATAGTGAVVAAGAGVSITGGVGVSVGVVAGVAVKAAVIAAVAIGVYLLADAIEVTAQVLAELTKKATTDLVTYPAFRTNGKLRIIPVPVPRVDAVAKIKPPLSNDFWSISQSAAMQIAIEASGSFEGPERDANVIGYYMHYHLAGRIGGHSFFGVPYMDVY